MFVSRRELREHGSGDHPKTSQRQLHHRKLGKERLLHIRRPQLKPEHVAVQLDALLPHLLGPLGAWLLNGQPRAQHLERGAGARAGELVPHQGEGQRVLVLLLLERVRLVDPLLELRHGRSERLGLDGQARERRRPGEKREAQRRPLLVHHGRVLLGRLRRALALVRPSEVGRHLVRVDEVEHRLRRRLHLLRAPARHVGLSQRGGRLRLPSEREHLEQQLEAERLALVERGRALSEHRVRQRVVPLRRGGRLAQRAEPLQPRAEDGALQLVLVLLHQPGLLGARHRLLIQRGADHLLILLVPVVVRRLRLLHGRRRRLERERQLCRLLRALVECHVAREHVARAHPLGQLRRRLAHVEVLVSATPHPALSHGLMPAVAALGRSAPPSVHDAVQRRGQRHPQQQRQLLEGGQLRAVGVAQQDGDRI
mmetsp:Transcript_2122/g.7013  ORF Transcript_2122/g.7013 Transcript_2122/m.7013 type:complete len:426 (-) Transcript_2122:1493-2770(-)